MRNKKGQFTKGKRPKWLCKRISKALKGKKKSKKFVENLRKIRIGWKFSQETKDKIRYKLKGNKNAIGKRHSPNKKSIEGLKKYVKENGAWNKGKKGWTIGTRAGFQKGHRFSVGERNSHWIKDRSKLKKRQERNDSTYKDWVKKVKKRDNNECILKDKKCFGYKIVHHILSWNEYPTLRYEINNGITLCQYHHPRKRIDEKRMIPIFIELVKVKSN